MKISPVSLDNYTIINRRLQEYITTGLTMYRRCCVADSYLLQDAIRLHIYKILENKSTVY